MKNSGFQLSARYLESGDQAGVFRSLDSRTAVASHESGSMSYIQHTREGQRLTGQAQAEWQFEWEAPRHPAPVTMHVTANAANQDDSEFGDTIHTRQLTIRPE
jgi:hypothetical protein